MGDVSSGGGSTGEDADAVHLMHKEKKRHDSETTGRNPGQGADLQLRPTESRSHECIMD